MSEQKKKKLKENDRIYNKYPQEIIDAVKQFTKIGDVMVADINPETLAKTVKWHMVHKQSMTPLKIVEKLGKVANMSDEEINYTDNGLVKLAFGQHKTSPLGNEFTLEQLMKGLKDLQKERKAGGVKKEKKDTVQITLATIIERTNVLVGQEVRKEEEKKEKKNAKKNEFADLEDLDGQGTSDSQPLL